MASSNHRAPSTTPAAAVPSATPAPLASVPHTQTNGTSAHGHAPASAPAPAPGESSPNGHNVPVQEPRPAPTPTTSKKGKGKKTLDSNEASKLVAARISQLEVDTAAEKEQEAEIGRCFLFYAA